MGDELFAFYEKQLAANIASLEGRLGHAAPRSRVDVAEIRHQARGELEDAEGSLAQLELEAAAVDPSKRVRSRDRVAAYRKTIQRIQAQYESLQPLDAPRSQSRSVEDSSMRLLEEQNDRLTETQRMAQESETIGAHVLSDLRRQREQIERNLAALDRAEEHLDTSNRTMNQMLRRMMANRIFLYTTGALMTACVLYLLYRKLK